MSNSRSTKGPTVIAREGAGLPRRYFFNGEGRVIVGLTLVETSEFEALDRRKGDSPLPNDGFSVKRWQELYDKHSAAWDAWMAASRAILRGITIETARSRSHTASPEAHE